MVERRSGHGWVRERVVVGGGMRVAMLSVLSASKRYRGPRT